MATVFNVDVNYLLNGDLGLSKTAEEALRHRQRFPDAWAYSGDAGSSHEKMRIAQEAVIRDTAFLADVAEYIATPDDEETMVVVENSDDRYLRKSMEPTERLAFFAGRIVQKLPALRKLALEDKQTEE